MKTMHATLTGLIVLCASATTAVADNPQAWLDAHNKQRAIHCVPALTWSNEVAASAQAWANQCTFSHEGQHVYGENLFWGTAGAYSPDSAVTSWYGENSNYSYATPVFSQATGHFTQVIWKSTTAIGCATARCGDKDYFVCRYSPPGNVAGQFAENVPMACTTKAESVPLPGSDIGMKMLTCKQGYVWRDARDGDGVCVTPQERSRAKQQNAAAASLVEGSGPNCKSGYVWRDAWSGDVVCVTPDERAQAHRQNAEAATRTK
jgi:uncharacterized protein YkwD